MVAIDNLCACPKLQFIAEHLEKVYIILRAPIFILFKVKLFLLDATDKDAEGEAPSLSVGKSCISFSESSISLTLSF